MKPMRPAPRSTTHRFAWLRRVTTLLASAALLIPAAAYADTSLPQGYHSDSLPQLPPSQLTQPVSDVEEADTLVDEYEDTDPSALTDFRAPLTPYGVWVDDPTYGTVWIPDPAFVGADFAPYQTAGHWALTPENEWLWVSDYDWGYIPFHYGRWVWIAGAGWAWIPGRLYAPSWVVWRVGDGGYIGWAPMPPTYYWVGGSVVMFGVVPPAAFVFCSTTYVFHEHVHSYVVHDHATIHHAAQHSHVYQGATPQGGAKTYKPASPTLVHAQIPKSSAPKAAVKPDPRTLAYAMPKTSSPASKASAPRAASDNRPTITPRSPRAAIVSPGQRPSPRAATAPAPRAALRLPRATVVPAPRAPTITPPRTRAPVLRTPTTRSTPAPAVTIPQPSAPQATVRPKSTPRVSVPSVAPAPVAPAPVKVAPKVKVPRRR